MRRPPFSVIIVAVFMVLNGVGAISSVLLTAADHAPPLMAVIDVLFGLGLFVVAWGLYRLRPWAWSTTVTLQVISALSAAAAWQSSPGAWLPAAIDLVLSCVVILLLVRAPVRTAFGPLFGPRV